MKFKSFILPALFLLMAACARPPAATAMLSERTLAQALSIELDGIRVSLVEVTERRIQGEAGSGSPSRTLLVVKYSITPLREDVFFKLSDKPFFLEPSQSADRAESGFKLILKASGAEADSYAADFPMDIEFGDLDHNELDWQRRTTCSYIGEPSEHVDGEWKNCNSQVAESVWDATLPAGQYSVTIRLETMRRSTFTEEGITVVVGEDQAEKDFVFTVSSRGS
ncbi:MAG: hypothetical protein JW923_08095 [Spirochaetales bacterium]|nr:hypothetical protein [Spirochaetales bacterium]